MTAPSDLFERLSFRGNPLANPASVVVSGAARFTVLRPRLLRLEWSETGKFEDRSTYAFPTRYAPASPFTTRNEGEELVIDTGVLTLRHRRHSGRFGPDSLSITLELNGEAVRWTPGTTDPWNLRGTRRTLDECEGDASLEEGLLSRAGWALFDDSRNVVFEDGWVAPRPEHDLQDWYFFGYGHDYKAALEDYVTFGGAVPLVPRFVLGAWWSRYWAYSAQELQKLVEDFAAHCLPLDVLAVDMDWHTPHAWTGYTWNRELFPDPAGLLRWMHDRGLHITLNLHPAQGVQAFEDIYPRFATAMGSDPATREPIPFRITDRRFVQNYFQLLHHPMEDDGVDFWWMDWQQGTTSEVKGLDPLPWINHLHFSDSTRRGRRPLLYSRWGGLGNHRYPIGFSGDTVVGWEALQFQPYLTATAANVAYGWWGHDIGGHMGGATEPELYARWVQFGALSPCLRLHATNDPRAERRPWVYPREVFHAVQAAFHLRYRLIPYIYTMARHNSDTGLPLCRPMYYEYPEEDAAYVARYQYLFGDEIIAAPIIHPADPATGLAATDVWIPAGTWIDLATRESFHGPRWVRLVGDLERIPMLVRAGAIVPLAAAFPARPTAPIAPWTSEAMSPGSLILAIFPGPAGHFRLYEDDGISERYKEGECEWTDVTARMDGESTWVVEVAAVEGHCATVPAEREYEIHLEGSRRPRQVLLDGVENSDWSYDPATLCTTISVPRRDKRQPVRVTAVAEGPISALGDAHNEAVVRADVRRLLGQTGPAEPDSLEALLEAARRADLPGRNDAVARLGGPLVRIVEFVTLEEARRQLGRVIVGAPAAGDPYDLEADFTLFRSGRPERRTVRIEGTTTDQILSVPFAFDGRVETLCWEAEVRLAWRGHTLAYSHRSQPLFASVYAWLGRVYNPEEEVLPREAVLTGAALGNGVPPWKVYQQQVAGLRNLVQPHVMHLGSECRDRLQAGEPLAAYLVTTIISPDERQAALLCRTRTPLEVFLNGERAQMGPEEEDRSYHPFQVRRGQGLHLRAGPNILVVHTRPDPAGNAPWYFAAGFTGPAGEWMTDLLASASYVPPHSKIT